jgi:hypothetical protein
MPHRTVTKVLSLESIYTLIQCGHQAPRCTYAVASSTNCLVAVQTSKPDEHQLERDAGWHGCRVITYNPPRRLVCRMRSELSAAFPSVKAHHDSMVFRMCSSQRLGRVTTTLHPSGNAGWQHRLRQRRSDAMHLRPPA